MMMTRKTYRQVAEVFAAQPMTIEIEKVMLGMADVFAADNPRFVRNTFYAACRNVRHDTLRGCPTDPATGKLAGLRR